MFRRKEGIYKLIFKDGTSGFYNWTILWDKNESKLKRFWLKTFPFTNYGNFEGKFERHIKKIIPLRKGNYYDKEMFNELETYKHKYLKEIEANQAFRHYLPEKDEKDPVIRTFNIWINQARTQEMLSHWCEPMYGYIDLEVEDLGMVLEHCWKDAFNVCTTMWQEAYSEGRNYLE